MPSSLLDYLPQNALIFVDDLSILESTVSEIEEQAVKLRAELVAEGTLREDFPVPYISWSEIFDTLQGCGFQELGRSTAQDDVLDGHDEESLAAQFGKIERFGGRLKPFMEYLSRITAEKSLTIIVSRQAARLEELWSERNAGTDDLLPEVRLLRSSLWRGHFRRGGR